MESMTAFVASIPAIARDAVHTMMLCSYGRMRMHEGTCVHPYSCRSTGGYHALAVGVYAYARRHMRTPTLAILLHYCRWLVGYTIYGPVGATRRMAPGTYM